MTHQTKAIAPYHKSYHKGGRAPLSDPDTFTLDMAPEELHTAITEGCHPTISDATTSSALFALLIVLVEKDLSDELMHGLMKSDYPIADIARYQHPEWRQLQIDTARQRWADCQRDLRRPMRKDPNSPFPVPDLSKQPHPTFDNVRREIYGRLGIERLRHDRWSGDIVIDHNHTVLSGAPTVEEIWARLGEGQDGITIACTTLGVYLAKIADAAPFDGYYEMQIGLILKGRAEIARREGNGEVFGEKFLESLIPRCFKLEDTALGRAASRLLLREKMAFAMVPPTQDRPVKSQALLMLAGYGGAGKSFFAYIMANGADDTHDSLFGEDLCYDSFDFTKIPDRDRFYRTGKATVAEVKEGLGFKSNSDHVKAETDRKWFSFDPKFRSITVTYFRRYVMIMTTEDVEPLQREHAWRRWIVIDIEDSPVFQKLRDEGKPEEHRIDAEWLISNYVVLNALAYDLLKWEGNLRLEDTDLKVVKEDNERHVSIANWELALLHDLQPVLADKAAAAEEGEKFEKLANGEAYEGNGVEPNGPARSWFHGEAIARWAESRSVRPSSKELSAFLQRLGFHRTELRGEKVGGAWKYHRDWLTADLQEWNKTEIDGKKVTRSYKDFGYQYEWKNTSLMEPHFAPVAKKAKSNGSDNTASEGDKATTLDEATNVTNITH